MILWVHYSEYGTIKEDKLFEAYADWAEKDGYADRIGIHTAAVLLRGETDKYKNIEKLNYLIDRLLLRRKAELPQDNNELENWSFFGRTMIETK